MLRRTLSSVPAALISGLTLPVIAAPMYLLSGPELVIAACKAGVIGTFNSLNAVDDATLVSWLDRINAEIEASRDEGQRPAPYAVNLIVRKTDRFSSDLATIQRFAPPVVITGIGDPSEVVRVVHAYGGLVLHDVATIRHAERAIAAGVDGLILLSAGAGGHTGHANPFAFVREVRTLWDGLVILAGAISDGYGVRAATALGADLAYMGTRFAATQESRAAASYKEMLTQHNMGDIVVTDRISGLPAAFMKGSLIAAGLDPAALPPLKAPFIADLPENIKPWHDVWSAGQGVGIITDIPTVEELVSRLAEEYQRA